MKHKIASTSILVLLCGLLFAPAVQAQENPVVRGYLFYSATCDHCQWVREEVIPSLDREFGQQLQIMAVEISDENNYRWWLDVARAYGVDESDLDVPTLFIGEDAMVNEAEIDLKAHGLIQDYLDQGGVDYPDVSRPGGPLEPAVRFILFWSPTCPHCTHVKEEVLPPLKARYGDRLQWEAYSVEQEDNYLALLELGSRANVREDWRGNVPTILIGDEYSTYALFVGGNEVEAYLPEAIEWFMGAAASTCQDGKTSCSRRRPPSLPRTPPRRQPRSAQPILHPSTWPTLRRWDAANAIASRSR